MAASFSIEQVVAEEKINEDLNMESGLFL